MSVNGLNQATDQNVLSLRTELAKVGLLVSADPTSARNVRLRELIVSKTRYEIGDVVDILADLPDEEANDLEIEQGPQPRADTLAVIIWAGTQLTGFQIARLRDVYTGLGAEVKHGFTEPLSRILCDRVTLDPEHKVNEQMKGFMGGGNGVHQALDQELSHAKATSQCVDILSGIAGEVLVYRPIDDFFIRFDLQQIPGNWRPYGPTQAEPLIAPPLDASKKIILLTIGHGHPQGHTSFPGRGLKSQPEIADMLGQTSRQPTVFRIPLQCYPQAAVESWPGQGGAASIDNPDRSDDNEMENWIRDNLESAVTEWLSNL